MQIVGLTWLGTRTDRADQLNAFYREVLGLSGHRISDTQTLSPLEAVGNLASELVRCDGDDEPVAIEPPADDRRHGSADPRPEWLIRDAGATAGTWRG
jgi:catechol 2,3-dioxygenase-like lactoylglutathione lyase family enzyme